MGTYNIISKAQRYSALRSFQPTKAQRKMRDLSFQISERQRNFRNELLIQLKRNTIPQPRNGLFVQR